MSVAIAVGSAVFFPDFSFQQVLETASARPLQEDWGDFARPSMHNSRFCSCVSPSCETYLDMHNPACFFACFCYISTGTLLQIVG